MDRSGYANWLIALYVIPIVISVYAIFMAIFNSPYGVNYVVIRNSVLCLAIYSIAALIVIFQQRMARMFSIVFVGIQYILSFCFIAWLVLVFTIEASSIREDGGSTDSLLLGIVIFSTLILTFISLQLWMAIKLVERSH